MAKLSANQVAAYAVAAGFPQGRVLVEAVSVAMAESSGVTDVVNAEGNTGLWQVGPKGSRNDAGVGLSVTQLKNPGINAQAAFTIWNRDGKTFAKSWSTWGTGPQVAWAAGAGTAMWGAPGRGPITPGTLADAAVAPLAAAAGAVPGLKGVDALAVDADKLGRWVTTPSNWVRVALVVVGAVLAVAGLNQVAKPVTAPVVATGKQAAKTAAMAAAL